MQHYIEKIFTAPVYDVATKTPLDAMPRLSDRIGHNVLCKREDLQPVFSFKLRGAYTKMYRLSSGRRTRARRDLRLGGQPRPRRRSFCQPPRHARGHRHARHHAANQD